MSKLPFFERFRTRLSLLIILLVVPAFALVLYSNLAQRRISCGGREERVTPKQARLLEMFLRSPGQLLTRKQIIKHVWDTDYTGDTRTLDVHMSWLRSVIEPNPRKPRYLKTLRGQGYRLDIPG